MKLTERDERRFWAKVALPNERGCMLWSAYRNRDGYGRFLLSARPVAAHRISYTLAYGEIPKGLSLDHLCRVRHCVAPNHLEPVTTQENIRRGNGVGGVNARKTHCKRGHEFTEANTYLRKDGGRACRQCALRRAAALYTARRAAS